MATGLGLLRLSPRDFWAMTPIEFLHASGWVTHGAVARPARADLADLMRRFPDQ